MEIKQTNIGKLNNHDVIKYELITHTGISVDILNYGAIISGICVPDQNGIKENVVICFDDLTAYAKNVPHLGAVIGRCAGRISNGKFSLDGKTFDISKNNDGNCLHGGFSGLDKKFWDVSVLNNGIKLSYFSADGEEGFPGNVSFEVYYRILENDTLAITYKAFPDRPTIINLTNHSYFNLSGAADSGISQELRIASSKYCELDDSFAPTGVINSVENSVFDFRQQKLISTDISNEVLAKAGGYDLPYILSHGANPDIILYDPVSKRQLSITTTENCVILYTGNKMAGNDSVNNKKQCTKYLGICLETMEVPNGINQSVFSPSIYSEEDPYNSTTLWQFTFG